MPWFNGSKPKALIYTKWTVANTINAITKKLMTEMVN